MFGKYKGTVTEIVPEGAFVDIGADMQGFLPILQISDRRVRDVRDFLKEGQEVQVWINRGYREGAEPQLTMRASKVPVPVNWSAFEGIPPEQWLSGQVAAVLDYGAFVKVTAPDGKSKANGIVHISQLSAREFVKDVFAVVEAGEMVKVRILNVDAENDRMSLSMLPIEGQSSNMEEEN